MKKIIFLLILFISSTVSIWAQDNITKDAAVTYINDIRSKYNIEKLLINDSLNQAAQAHSEYMYLNNSFKSEEETDKKGFTGVYFFDRSLYFNYKGIPAIELIDKDSKTYLNAAENLMNNPYDRVQLLNPYVNNIGMGKKENKMSFIVGNNKSTGKSNVFMYPYNGQKDVLDSVDYASFRINPLKKWTEYQEYRNLGTPITITNMNEKDVESISNIKIVFTNISKNKPVKYIYNYLKNDKDLKKTMIIIPLQKYEVGSKYYVSVSATYTFTDKTSKFVQENVSFIAIKGQESSDSDTIYANSDKYMDINGHWLGKYKNELIKRNIIFEKRKNEFAPDELITREETVRMLVQALELKSDNRSAVNFKDVRKDDPYYQYINAASRYNIISGYNNEFRPKNNITREQLVTIIMRLYNNTMDIDKFDSNAIENIDFSDINSVSDWSVVYVKQAKFLKFINGRENNRFFPKSYITRAEAAIIVNRMVTNIENAETTIIVK